MQLFLLFETLKKQTVIFTMAPCKAGKKRINFVQYHDGKNKRNAKPCCITFFTIVYNIVY